jgi:hypothetical protein
MIRRIAPAAVSAVLIFLSCYRGYGLDPPGKTSGIEGRITFRGARPDSTREIWIAALKQYPSGITDQNELMAFVIQNLVNYKLVTGGDGQDFQLELTPGEYGWVIVAWFPDVDAWMFSVKELGAYERPGTGKPASVSVRSGVMTDGVDIMADFANVQRATPFF